MVTGNRLNSIQQKHRLSDPIYVTRPNLPKLSDYNRYLEKIWESGWLTNDGQFHQDFEKRLKEYLDVKHLNIFVNGTIALLVALQSLRVNSGEVITTPFTFPATSHVLYWNGIKPVYCDIEDKTFNIDPTKIEGLITPETKGILVEIRKRRIIPQVTYFLYISKNTLKHIVYQQFSYHH